MIDMNVKLPAKYYKYADRKIDDCDKNKSSKISVSFSAYQACKLEKFAVNSGKMISDIFKEILIDEGILDEKNAKLSGKKKHSSRFLNVDCEEQKGTGASKVYHIPLTECGEVQVYKAMLEKGVDLSFFLKSRMVKREQNRKEYQIYEIEDLSY